MRFLLPIVALLAAGCVLPNLAPPDGNGPPASVLADLRAFDYATCTKEARASNVTHPIAAYVAAQPTELVVATHDSAAFDAAVLEEFNRTYNARVRLVKMGDAGEALNKLILERHAPRADLFYGVDNNLVVRAHKWGLFQAYQPRDAGVVPACLVFDTSWHATPIDYGFVDVNYDRAWMTAHGRTPPADLADLAKPEWKGKLVVEHPGTSSPGLAFLLATIARYGDAGNATAWDFWRDLAANEVRVADGWESAYYTHFTKYGGDRPLVVSYTTSPAAEAYYGGLATAPTGSVPGTAYLQIEGLGILKNAKQPALAKAFVEFALSKRFQESFPTTMWVYPVNPAAALDPSFANATVPAKPAVLDPLAVAASQAEWIDLWTARLEG